MISQESVERIKSDASLLEVASETVQLKRSGQYYSGLCPFHAEKSPSFFVRDSSNSYTCFGCGASGNVIAFVMGTRAMTFPDAVEYLASRFKIELKFEKGTKPQGPSIDREKLFAISRTAYLFFRRSLAQVRGGSGEFRKVGEYLRKRGLSSEAINTFGIGYGPNQRGALIETLKQAGFDEESILLTGLVRRTAAGELYELFRARLVFPIFVDSKRIAAFGGRVVPGVMEPSYEAQAPKYLNSPESPVYNKSKTVYGLPQAMESIRESGEMYVVEGYMDVVRLWMAGVRNSVACCGTAMTEQHVKRFTGLCNRVHLLFDGDTAGRGAASKAFLATRNAAVDLDVCFLPEGKDPDDFAGEFKGDTADALKGLPKAELIDAYIDGLLSRSGCSINERPGPNLLGRLCDDVAKALAGVDKEVVRTSLLTRAGRRLGVDSAQLERLMNGAGTTNKRVPESGSKFDGADSARTHPIDAQNSGRGHPGSGTPQVVQERGDIQSLPRLDKELLRSVMALKDAVLPGLVRHSVLADGLQPVTVRFVMRFENIFTSADEDEIRQRQAVKALLSEFGPDWVALWKESYLMVERGVQMQEVYNQCLTTFERNRLQHQIALLQIELKGPLQESEKDKVMTDILNLSRQRDAMARGLDLSPSNS